MKKLILHLIFFFIVIGDLVGEGFQMKSLDYTFKPFIMIWIAVYFFTYAKQVDKQVVKLIFFAFIFSWIGDILLMFADKNNIFFLLGLVSFLFAQIVYINLFLRTINLSGKKSFIKERPFWIIAYIVYGLAFYIVLFNHLDAVLKIGVLVYMVALLGMSVMALNRFGNGHPISFSLVFTGSVLFVLSDSMIATNKFISPIPYEGILIMTTYFGAQYLIMRGILKQYE